jgi:hypothetical protein
MKNKVTWKKPKKLSFFGFIGADNIVLGIVK